MSDLPTRRLKASVALSLVTLSSLAYTLFLLVNHYSVNVLYWDQWDMLGPLFRKDGWLAEFRYQHGPHRLGLGAWFTHVIYELTSWNVRAEAFAIMIVVVAATLLAVVFYWTQTKSDSPYVVIIPASMLSLASFEVYTSAPNPSHGALPLLLIVLLCFSLVSNDSWLRSVLLVLLTSALVHTGFGLLCGPLMIVFCFLVLTISEPLSQLVRGLQRPVVMRRVITLLGVCLGVGWFFVNYVHNDASGCDPTRIPTSREYLQFASLLLTKLMGNSSPEAPGVFYLAAPILVTWLASLGIAVHRAFNEVRTGRVGVGCVSTFLLCYSLSFVAMSALGRTCAGVHYGASSRYQIHLAPAYIAITLILANKQKYLAVRLLQLSGFVFLLWGSLQTLKVDRFGLRAPRTVRLEGKSCLLQHRDVDYCFKHVPNFLYPVPHRVEMAERIKWMEENRLNLFSPESGH